MSLPSLFIASEGLLSRPVSVSLGIASLGFLRSVEIIEIIDTHDGDDKWLEKEREAKKRLRERLTDVYEVLVEGRVDEPAIVAEAQQISEQAQVDLPIATLQRRVQQMEALYERYMDLKNEHDDLTDLMELH